MPGESLLEQSKASDVLRRLSNKEANLRPRLAQEGGLNLAQKGRLKRVSSATNLDLTSPHGKKEKALVIPNLNMHSNVVGEITSLLEALNPRQKMSSAVLEGPEGTSDELQNEIASLKSFLETFESEPTVLKGLEGTSKEEFLRALEVKLKSKMPQLIEYLQNGFNEIYVDKKVTDSDPSNFDPSKLKALQDVVKDAVNNPGAIRDISAVTEAFSATVSTETWDKFDAKTKVMLNDTMEALKGAATWLKRAPTSVEDRFKTVKAEQREKFAEDAVNLRMSSLKEGEVQDRIAIKSEVMAAFNGSPEEFIDERIKELKSALAADFKTASIAAMEAAASIDDFGMSFAFSQHLEPEPGSVSDQVNQQVKQLIRKAGAALNNAANELKNTQHALKPPKETWEKMKGGSHRIAKAVWSEVKKTPSNVKFKARKT